MTHALAGAGAARLISPRRDWRPQLSLAAVLGSEVMDLDAALNLVDPNWYGRYHRVATHSAIGLAAIAILSAWIAWIVARRARWRRFGWGVAPNESGEIDRAPWRLFFAVAASAAALHWLGDWISGFGGIVPAWPLSRREFGLRAVLSLDRFIFISTAVWHLTVRHLDLPRGREAWIGAGWFAWVAIYVAARAIWGTPTAW